MGYVERVLGRNGLPTEGVRGESGRLYVVRHGEERVGVGGLAVYGTVALVRSVAVEESVRGEGFGTALCGALERRARERGVETVSLLTTTAADFVEDRGYERIDREAVPESIGETGEFSGVCPSTATCLGKSV